MQVLSRRALLGLSLGSLGWLAASRLAGAGSAGAAGAGRGLILIWLEGGPSQLETFDPKPGTRVGGPTRATATRIPGLSIASGLAQVAEQMHLASLIRSVVGVEGDHERATVLMKTGRRLDVALTHPSLGAVCASEAPEEGTEIPRYVSILGDGRASLGGYLGQRFDAFRIGDPAAPVEDVHAPVDAERYAERLADLALVEQRFAQGQQDAERISAHRDRTDRALRIMRSPDLAAFDVTGEPSAVQRAYGDHPFGRGCLAARRLIEAGVSCVEVTLGGWDTHTNNFGATALLNAQLDSGLSALLSDLAQRELLSRTLVVCTGEFGRTPVINAADGRDHWPGGFSALVAGVGVRAGQVIGETGEGVDPPADAVKVADLYATLLTALGISPESENMTSIGRPVKLAEGKPISRLLAAAPSR